MGVERREVLVASSRSRGRSRERASRITGARSRSRVTAIQRGAGPSRTASLPTVLLEGPLVHPPPDEWGVLEQQIPRIEIGHAREAPPIVTKPVDVAHGGRRGIPCAARDPQTHRRPDAEIVKNLGGANLKGGPGGAPAEEQPDLLCRSKLFERPRRHTISYGGVESYIPQPGSKAVKRKLGSGSAAHSSGACRSCWMVAARNRHGEQHLPGAELVCIGCDLIRRPHASREPTQTKSAHFKASPVGIRFLCSVCRGGKCCGGGTPRKPDSSLLTHPSASAAARACARSGYGGTAFARSLAPSGSWLACPAVAPAPRQLVVLDQPCILLLGQSCVVSAGVGNAAEGVHPGNQIHR